MPAPASPGFIAELIRRFAGERGAVYYLKDAAGEPVAGRFVTWEGDTAYDLLAAAFDAGRGPRGAYLMWRVLAEVGRRGLALDAVGVNVESIARFKESFGGRLTPYYVVTGYRSWVARAFYGARRRLAP
jgi:hypothetical protein